MTSQTLLTLLSTVTKMAGRHWWLTALLWGVLIAPAQAALELRVAIEQDVPKVRIGSSVNAVVRNGSGQVLGEIQGMSGFEAQRRNNAVVMDRWQAPLISIEPKDKNGVVWIGDRWYRGRAVVKLTGSSLTAVNYVDLEHYLYSVLGGEMNGNWPQQALKAQAVAARSYALYRRQRYGTAVFDLCDTAQCQVYRGVQDESAGTQQAVNATAGQVLTHNGRIIEALFHSSSGGYTENVEDVWRSGPIPYLRAVPDADQGAPVFQWTRTITQQELTNLAPNVGRILNVVPVATSRTKGGRFRQIQVIGDRGSRVIEGERFRDVFNLRSSKFVIAANDMTSNPSITPPPANNPPVIAQPPASFTITGYGFGHGLGMSQYGALGLAQKGWNYQQIVLHYFSQTALAKIEVR
ncbi:MAG: SpoIID/LytB domain-containing protein [Synechococcales bacterium]|nr:SpoIID/LytB domain-containing protein [Synechococcales bacterium]